jgi:ribosomal protein S18 acetylase RimI-like enzyme
MSAVELRAMTEEEYVDWYPGAVSAYAEDHIRAGSMPADKAHEMAAKQFAELLPDGLATTAHHLLIGEVDGVRVGILWLNIPVDGAGVRAFVYDVEVEQSQRGKGYGRGMMVGAESYSRDHGAATIRLHVFGDNTVARSLYGSLGYVETNVNMAKPLGPAAT